MRRTLRNSGHVRETRPPDEELELHSARGLKVVNDGAEGAIPPGCSYSFTSKTAVFNTNEDKAAGFGSSYQVGPRQV